MSGTSKHKTPMTGLRLPPDLVRAVDDWCAAQRPAVTRTAFVVAAVEDFLASKTADRRKSIHAPVAMPCAVCVTVTRSDPQVTLAPPPVAAEVAQDPALVGVTKE